MLQRYEAGNEACSDPAIHILLDEFQGRAATVNKKLLQLLGFRQQSLERATRIGLAFSAWEPGAAGISLDKMQVELVSFGIECTGHRFIGWVELALRATALSTDV